MVSRMDGGESTQQVSAKLNKVDSDLGVKVTNVQPIAQNAQQRLDNEKQPLKLPAEKAKQLTDSMNTFLESANTQLRFKFHDELNEYYVTIVNPTTDEVIREIPSKKLMDIHAAMREFVGLLVDRKI